MPVRIVHLLNYNCILGIDFLTAFGLKINFGKRTWELPGNSHIFQFATSGSGPESVAGDCAGFSELSSDQREMIRWLTD